MFQVLVVCKFTETIVNKRVKSQDTLHPSDPTLVKRMAEMRRKLTLLIQLIYNLFMV